jgi:transcriptional regulator with XRE-family HTH domain
VAEGSPTVRRRELGALLRRLREEREMSVRQVTEHLLCSPSKVSRIETGQRGATLRDIRDLCDLYAVTDQAERERLMTLAREGKQQSWWQSHDLTYSTYVGLEAEAKSIRQFQSSVVPGLLQSADYARAVQTDVVPRHSPELIEQRVQVRLERQQLLKQPEPPALSAVLDESVLHRLVGGARVMSEQLSHLAEVAKLPNVLVNVISYNSGAHPGLESNFRILEFEKDIPGIVYTEGLIGSVYLERPEDFDRYRQVFDHLQAIALSEENTIELIENLAHEMK